MYICPYNVFCNEQCGGYQNCEIYEFIEDILKKQIRDSRVNKRIHRQEHGHKNYEHVKTSKYANIEKIMGMWRN